MMDRNLFLPTTRADMKARGISEFDFVYVTGDAYVDHPSFGVAIISRVLADAGVGCPPAVPIAVCGEVLDAAALNAFAYYGITHCTVVKG